MHRHAFTLIARPFSSSFKNPLCKTTKYPSPTMAASASASSSMGASTSSATDPPRTVDLYSSDRHKFSISTVAVSFSGVIAKMLGNKKQVALDKHDRKTLEPVVKYLSYTEDGKAEEFFHGENPKIGKLLDMAVVAHELDIPGMVDVVSEKIAHKMKNKSVDWVRAAFEIEGDDLKEAEVEQIKAQYPWAFEDVVDQDDDGEDQD